jgi:methyltransferase
LNAVPALLWVILALVAAQRGLELIVSRRNERRLLARGGFLAPRDGLALLVLVHVALLVLLPAEWALAPWSSVGVHTWPLISIAVGAAAFRYWAAWSLGDRYTVRVVRVAAEPLVARGPYRWMRHPIYRAVAVEIIAWPLAFGAWTTAAVLGALNVWALRRRIRFEEAHLALGPSPVRP